MGVPVKSSIPFQESIDFPEQALKSLRATWTPVPPFFRERLGG